MKNINAGLILFSINLTNLTNLIGSNDSIHVNRDLIRRRNRQLIYMSFLLFLNVFEKGSFIIY